MGQSHTHIGFYHTLSDVNVFVTALEISWSWGGGKVGISPVAILPNAIR